MLFRAYLRAAQQPRAGAARRFAALVPRGATAPGPAAAAKQADTTADAPAPAIISILGGDEKLLRPKIPGNVYAPATAYEQRYAIDEANPLLHTFREVGKYFPLAGGTAAGIEYGHTALVAGRGRRQLEVPESG